MAKCLCIGDYRKRIVFEAPQRVRDSYGEAHSEWSPVYRAWAAVRPLSGREIEIGKAIRGDVSHEVRFRLAPGRMKPLPTWRIAFPGEPGRYFQILAVLDLEERGKEAVIVCNETVV